MRYKNLLLLIAPVLFFSCKKASDPIAPPVTPVPTPPAIFLKDMVLSSLPSPYYHFEYDASKQISFVSFASEFDRYDVVYSGEKISEMRNNILVNKDRLQYFYNNAGMVEAINYADSTGVVYTRVDFFYEGGKLVKLERVKRMGSGFVFDKRMTMSYYADGNLMDLTSHYFPFSGQTEILYTTHYEQYDNKINVDGFSLIHEEFFDHFFLLPGIQLQKNSPGKETRTGDGDNFTVNYTYIYNDKDAPLTKTGDLQFLTGPRAGQHVSISSTFSYY
jgi:hypothetical protein